MIEVYASITDTKPSERYEVGGITVSEFLASKSDKYKAGDVQPFSCTVNGEIVKPADWCVTLIGSDDRVMFHHMPESDVKKGLGFVLPFWGVSAFIGNKTIKEIMPSFAMPDAAKMQSGEQGNQISQADAKANVARAGSTILQGFGRYIRYGDYLTQPRRYYIDSRTQAVDILISMGTGDYAIQNIKIGNTEIGKLNITAGSYAPGADISANKAHENWYSSPEVGATTGSTGIRLYNKDVVQSVEDAALSFGSPSDNSVFVWTAGTIPITWQSGDDIKISRFSKFYVIDTDVSYTVSTINADTSYLDFSDFVLGDTMRLRDELTSSIYLVDIVYISLDKKQVIVSPGIGDGYYSFYMTNFNTTYKILPGSGGFVYYFDKYKNGVKVSGWAGFEYQPNANDADLLIVNSALAEGWTNSIELAPIGDLSQVVEFDVMLPQGLGEIDDTTGDITALTRTIQLQYKVVGSATWSAPISYTITNNTRDQSGYTFKHTMTSKQRYEVRIRRVEKELTKTNALDRIEWTGLRCQLPTVTKYEGVTTLALTIIGTDEIASLSENQINAVVTRKLPPFTGGAPRSTRSIADAFHYVAKSMGYTDSEIDMVELSRLNSIWESRGDTFDYFFSETTVKDAMDTILNAGMAALTVDNGVLRPVRDEPRTVFEQGYSPENMTSRLRRSFSAVQPDEFDGVEVEYTNADTFTTETVLCLLPGDNGNRLDKIKLMGVTNRTRAWRIGMRARRSQKYRRWTYDFATEMDALNSGYLSYVPLVDDVPGYGAVSLMRSVDATKIVVNEPLDWQAGKAHVIAYRANDGKIVGPFACTKGGDNYTALVSIPAPLPMNYPDREPIHVYFGTTERWSFPALITEVNPQGRDTVSVTATNYDVRVYADDNNSAP